jgi:hypothetical protein
MLDVFDRTRIPRATLYAALGAAVTALAIGIPTDVIPNPVFGRPMVDVRPQDYVFLALTAAMAGILAASYAFPRARACSTEQGKATLSGLFTFLAVGCPTCNKVIVLLLGTSGALTFFEPLQPLLGLASLGLLAVAIWVRWRPLLRRATADPRPAPANQP